MIRDLDDMSDDDQRAERFRQRGIAIGRETALTLHQIAVWSPLELVRIARAEIARRARMEAEP